MTTSSPRPGETSPHDCRNPAISPVTGGPIGFWAAELTHPWLEFVQAGYAVDLASPQGGRTVVDSYSDPRDASGYSANDVISMGVLSTPKMAAMLETTRPLASINLADYDALFVCGGQSPMVTFIDDPALPGLVAKAYEAGKVVGRARSRSGQDPGAAVDPHGNGRCAEFPFHVGPADAVTGVG